MPADPNTPRISVCGLPLPLPANFDYTTHRKHPVDTPAPDDMELLEKNRRNVHTETHNADSVSMTRDYEEAIANAESVAALDVGKKLKVYYAYTEDKKHLLVGSKEVVEATCYIRVGRKPEPVNSQRTENSWRAEDSRRDG